MIALVPRRADPLVAVDGGDLASGVGNRGTNVAGNFEQHKILVTLKLGLAPLRVLEPNKSFDFSGQLPR